MKAARLDIDLASRASGYWAQAYREQRDTADDLEAFESSSEGGFLRCKHDDAVARGLIEAEREPSPGTGLGL